MALRWRRQQPAPHSNPINNNGPLVYNLDRFYNEDFVGSRRGRSWAGICFAVVSGTIIFVSLLAQRYPDKVKDTASNTWGVPVATPCHCNLSVISLLKNGKENPCKEYCWDQIQWTQAPRAVVSPSKPYGSFQLFGNCKKEEQLSLKNSTTPVLIPRSNSSLLPEYETLIESQFRDMHLLFMGGYILKQLFDVLPSVLSDSPGLVLSDQHYIYSANGKGIEPIRQCVTDSKTKSQHCWRNETVRSSCSCTTVTTLQNTISNTTIKYARAFGMEFTDDGGTKQTYGFSYNTIREALYSKLAQSASAVILNFDVVASVKTHDTEGFANMLQFIKKWSTQQKVIYALTLPEHYTTNKSTVTYGDEHIKGHECAATAAERHWTDTSAQETLRGVDMIDLFPVSATQGHMHSNHEGDCNSWCLAYDLFYVFWAVLADAIHSAT
jgi:hypothetical protein